MQVKSSEINRDPRSTLRKRVTSIRPIDDDLPLHEVPAVFLTQKLIVITNAQSLELTLVVFRPELVS